MWGHSPVPTQKPGFWVCGELAVSALWKPLCPVRRGVAVDTDLVCSAILQVRRAGAGAGQRGLRHADGAHHRVAQPERLLPAPHHLRLLHAHLHHLHPPAAREPEPEPAGEPVQRGALHAAAAPTAQEGRAAAAAHQRGTQGLLGPPRRSGRCRGRAARRRHRQRPEVLRLCAQPALRGAWGPGVGVACAQVYPRNPTLRGQTRLEPHWSAGLPLVGGILSETLRIVYEEADFLEIRLSFLPLNVCIYFGHFYEKHFIPFPLTDLEIEPPPSEEGPSRPRAAASLPAGCPVPTALQRPDAPCCRSPRGACPRADTTAGSSPTAV